MSRNPSCAEHDYRANRVGWEAPFGAVSET